MSYRFTIINAYWAFLKESGVLKIEESESEVLKIEELESELLWLHSPGFFIAHVLKFLVCFHCAAFRSHGTSSCWFPFLILATIWSRLHVPEHEVVKCSLEIVSCRKSVLAPQLLSQHIFFVAVFECDSCGARPDCYRPHAGCFRGPVSSKRDVARLQQ
jgi:hypothetical protein